MSSSKKQKEKKSKYSNSKQNIFLAICGFVILFLIWIVANYFLGDTRVPSPWRIASRFVNSMFFSSEIRFQGAGSHGFFPHVLATFGRYLLGTAIGLALSFLCIFFATRFKLFRDLLSPIVEVLRAIPPLAISPFLLLWFGTTPVSIIGLVAFYVFVMVFVAGLEAIGKLDPSYVNFARTLGADQTTVAMEIIIPAVFPALAGPIKVAVSWSWGLVIVGELLGAKSGIGRILNSFIALTATDLVVVGIVWILILSVIVEKLVTVTLQYLLRWDNKIEI